MTLRDTSNSEQAAATSHEEAMPSWLYRPILEQLPTPIVVCDRSLRITACNAAMAALLGTASADVVGTHVDDLRDQRHRPAFARALAGELVSYDAPYRATSTNVRLWGTWTFAPLRHPDGQIGGVIVLFIDRALHRDVEHAVRSSEALLGEMQRLGRIGNWSWDPQCGVLAASPEFHRILGLPKGQDIAQPADFARLVHMDDRFALEDYVRAALAEQHSYASCEFRVVRPDGAEPWVVMRAEVKYGADGRPRLAWGTMQDVTERRLLQEQLRRAQKMEALGQLAGGVAHDFNNMLTVINVECDFLSESLHGQGAQLLEVDEIRRAADRAAGLTQQLLAFSRKQVLRPRTIDLNDVIVETTTMLRRLIGEDVELVTSLAPKLPAILADPGQIVQVLVNLAVNARDAMPSGGVLTIATSTNTAAVDDGCVPAGDYVSLVVADTGQGMEESARQRIFEPFFTTKPAGKGTGLGLSTVAGIVEQSGGYITVASERRRGSRFAIHLPAVARETALIQHPHRARAVIPRRFATVLLVEDDAALRVVAQRALEREGYTVLPAEDGYDALAIAETFPDRIDLLVADLVLPGINAREMAARLLGRRPGIRVLFATGYPDDEILRRGLLDGASNVLEKPFSAAQLTDAVQRALSEKSSDGQDLGVG